jgi:predicted kinase
MGYKAIHFAQWLEDMSKKVYIMRGVPGAGKSYRARELAGDEGVIFSTDDFWGTDPEEYQANWEKHAKAGRTGQMLGKYHRMNFERAEEAMKAGVSPIIIDNTNVDRRAMKPYVRAAVEHGYDVEFAESESKWWQKIRPMLSNKAANEKELRRAAEMLAGRTVHGVPPEAIYGMMQRWHNDPTVEEFI